MIFAKIWYSPTEYHQVNAIWNYEGEAKSISGVDFWKQEGRIFSFDCALDSTILWIMQRELTENNLYKMHYGIRKARVEIYKDADLISEGYLCDDSFSITDHGTDVNGNYIEIIKIKFYDLFGCLVRVLENKTIHLVASNNYVMLWDLITLILATYGNEHVAGQNEVPTVWLDWLIFTKAWLPMPDYGYDYEDFVIKSVTDITDAAVAWGQNDPNVINHKDYMYIQAGTNYPRLTVVRHDIEWQISWYWAYIHIVTYDIVGAVAVLVNDVSDRSISFTDYDENKSILLTAHGQPALDDMTFINAHNSLVSGGVVLEIVASQLKLTGKAYIDRIQISTTGDYNVTDVLGMCLNIMYGWLDTNGHEIILKNKLPWDWDQVATVINDASSLTAETVMGEIEYKPACDWLDNKDEILRIINDYFNQAAAGILINTNFGTGQAINICEYVAIRGYSGYVNKLDKNIETGWITATAISKVAGVLISELLCELLFEASLWKRSAVQTYSVNRAWSSALMHIETPEIVIGETTINPYWIQVQGDNKWEHELDIPRVNGIVNVVIEVSFFPTLESSEINGIISNSNLYNLLKVSVKGKTNQAEIETIGTKSFLAIINLRSPIQSYTINQEWLYPTMTINTPTIELGEETIRPYWVRKTGQTEWVNDLILSAVNDEINATIEISFLMTSEGLDINGSIINSHPGMSLIVNVTGKTVKIPEYSNIIHDARISNGMTWGFVDDYSTYYETLDRLISWKTYNNAVSLISYSGYEGDLKENPSKSTEQNNLNGYSTPEFHSHAKPSGWSKNWFNIGIINGFNTNTYSGFSFAGMFKPNPNLLDDIDEYETLFALCGRRYGLSNIFTMMRISYAPKLGVSTPNFNKLLIYGNQYDYYGQYSVNREITLPDGLVSHTVSNNIVPIDQWNMIVVVFDWENTNERTMKTYVNGILVDTYVVTNWLTKAAIDVIYASNKPYTNGLFIGADGYQGANNYARQGFVGHLADNISWKMPISDQDVEDMFNYWSVLFNGYLNL